MMKGIYIVVLLCIFGTVHSRQNDAEYAEELLLEAKKVRWNQDGTGDMELDYTAKWVELAQLVESVPHLKQQWEDRVKMQETGYEFPFPPFECEVQPSATPPTSVHMLRPSDINVVAAVGDSITAGNGLGATRLVDVAYMNRGESWSVGGNEDLDKKVITLGNILKKFNPDLKGYSRCRSSLYDADYAWMNIAAPGSTSRDVELQSLGVIARMKLDETIDFENDWKIVTIWVGGNDLCGSCHRPDRYDPIPYRQQIEAGLDLLHAQLPRTIVNVVVMFDITPLPELGESDFCTIMQWIYCDCVTNSTTVPQLKPRQMGYYDELSQLIECSGKYDVSDDFTVVLQPMFRDMLPPKDPITGEWDPSFLSADCFHPARKAHQAFAYMLWNTMLIPVGEKPFTLDYYEENPHYDCPTPEKPYIFTNINSQPGWIPPSATTTTTTTTTNSQSSWVPPSATTTTTTNSQPSWVPPSATTTTATTQAPQGDSGVTLRAGLLTLIVALCAVHFQLSIQ